MKIGIAQLNTTVGDLEGNRQLILSSYRRLVSRGASWVVFPELCLCGYPPMDLLHKRRFLDDCLESLERIAAESTVPLVIGVPLLRQGTGNAVSNAAVVCAQGKVIASVAKRLLPTYDVFDELRYFEPGSEACCVSFGGVRVGLTICEDIWNDGRKEGRYRDDPVADLIPHHPDVLFNLSASPWHVGKDHARMEHVRDAARKLGCPVVYCNAIGGNDELVFDGRSTVADAQGAVRARLAAFAQDEAVVDLSRLQELPVCEADRSSDAAQICDALTLGLRDYAYKCGFRKAVIGLSGGIDSAVTAALAVRALGREHVTGISLPSRISSQHSRDDAGQLAKNLGIAYHSLPIASVVEAVEAALEPVFAGMPADVTEENIQARARGILLMAYSNKMGALLLTTGNKSEMAVGYCTLYGDMAGGLAVISDVLKTVVYDLAHYLNSCEPVIPESTISKAPSAELRPDQKDEDSLPPYPVLDAILRLYIEQGKTRADIIALGYDAALVHDIARKVDLNEYKRKQAPPGLKMTPTAFGVGRRIPIVQRYVG
jgi:NAD+ synthase (glutamine-hydrolysing)